MVVIEHLVVAMESPPLAQLTVPGTGQRVEQLTIVEGGQSVKVLVTEVATEVILLRHVSNHHRVEQRVVEVRFAHLLQVQQHHARVEAGKAVATAGGGRAHWRVGMGATIFAEDVTVEARMSRLVLSSDILHSQHLPIDRLLVIGKADEFVGLETIKLFVQFQQVTIELDIDIEQRQPAGHRSGEDAMQHHRVEEECIRVVRVGLVSEVGAQTGQKVLEPILHHQGVDEEVTSEGASRLTQVLEVHLLLLVGLLRRVIVVMVEIRFEYQLLVHLLHRLAHVGSDVAIGDQMHTQRARVEAGGVQVGQDRVQRVGEFVKQLTRILFVGGRLEQGEGEVVGTVGVVLATEVDRLAQLVAVSGEWSRAC